MIWKLTLIFLWLQGTYCLNFTQDIGWIKYLKPLKDGEISAECKVLEEDPTETLCDKHIKLYVEKLQNPTNLIGSWAFKSKHQLVLNTSKGSHYRFFLQSA